MSTRWSNERSFAEHKDIEANVMSMHRTGQYIALADLRMIYIIDIDSPSKIVRQVNRVSKWDVVASEWNPHHSNQSLFAVCYNQTTAIYSFGDCTPSPPKNVDSTAAMMGRTQEPIFSLKGHRRNITDINWSPTDENLIATASIDCFAHIWDIKDHRKPAISFSSVVGPNHVKWCKTDPNTLATSMEGDIRIWDKRNGNYPVYYITAHDKTINCLDWVPNSSVKLTTCSQDRTVRFWDITKLDNGESAPTLSTKLPVWKAKHTPFSNGLITVVVPQFRRTGDINSLWLWNTNNFEQPVHSFFGPTDVVIDFAWRWTTEAQNAELVTWSKDRTFRIWSVDHYILNLVSDPPQTPQQKSSSDRLKIIFCNTIGPDHDEGNSPSINGLEDDSIDKRANRPLLPTLSTNIVPKLKSPDYTKDRLENEKDLLYKGSGRPGDFKTCKPTTLSFTNHQEPIASSLITPKTLQDEFAIMNMKIPGLKFEDLNPIKQHCIVSAEISGCILRLKISVPQTYPINVPPAFEFLDDDVQMATSKTFLNDLKIDLLQILQETAENQVKRNRPCLEPCLRNFAASLKKRKSAMSPASSDLAMKNYSSLYGNFHDASVPFPKISGGRFCGSNMLVCFGKLPYLKTMSNSNSQCTPRALSDLSAYLQTNYRPFLSSIEIQEMNHKDSYEISSYPYYCYSERKSRRPMRGSSRNSKCGPIVIYTCDLIPCSQSLAASYVFNDKDKVEMCRANAAIAAKENRKDLQQIWTLAGLSIRPELSDVTDSMDVPWSMHPFGEKLIDSLIDFYLRSLGDIQMAAMLCCVASDRCNVCGKFSCNPFNHRKTSDSSFAKLQQGSSKVHSTSTNMSRQNGSSTELSPVDLEPMWTQRDCIKLLYSDILLRWGLINKQALVMKYVIANSNTSEYLNWSIDGLHGPKGWRCILCNLSIRSHFFICCACGHAGHTIHMSEWFSTNDECPSGCGCRCLSVPFY